MGSGIIGLAHAYGAAGLGQRVVMSDRRQRASEASVRNLGLIWRIRRAHGARHQLALHSRETWLQVLKVTVAVLVDRVDAPYLSERRSGGGSRVCEPRSQTRLRLRLPECLSSARATGRHQSKGLIGGLWSD
jgi:glycine/D-amino acid oxidase-like deaminating enzyme